MSFTAQEKARILFYLGYSVFEDDGPAMRAVNSLDAKEATAGFLVREVMDRIEDIRTQVHKTIPLGKAIEDGSIKLRAHYTLDHLWRLGRNYISQLATFTKIVVHSDIFGTGGVSRDPAGFYNQDPSERRFGGGGDGKF